jgi:hypothetical protein
LTLNHDPFDLIEGDLIIAAVIKTGCPGGLVISHLLGYLKLASVP